MLEALYCYFLWFTEHPGVSKSNLSDMLKVNHKCILILPPRNNLPSSYEEAINFIEPFLLPLETVHACPNHCIVYRDSPRYKYAGLASCPECGMACYIGNSKRPRHSFYYFPIGPRLKRMYGDPVISELLQSHGCPRSGNGGDNDIMADIHNSPQFQEANKEGGVFKGDPRGLSLQFSTDGMNPFTHETYSMWPLTLTVLNLPKGIRSLFTSIMLLGIVPGKSETSIKLDAYIEVFVDDLLKLQGSEMYDGYLKSNFIFRAKIMNYVLDYRGLNKLFAAFGANALQGCMWCEIEGKLYWFYIFLHQCSS